MTHLALVAEVRAAFSQEVDAEPPMTLRGSRAKRSKSGGLPAPSIVSTANDAQPIAAKHAMQKAPRIFLLGLVASVISLPLGIILTIVLLPLWSWVEATTGIESVGHSGPADWCYWVTLGVVFGGIAAPLLICERRNRAS